MKRLFFFIAAYLPALVFAQAPASNFTVTGKVGNLNLPARAYLFYQVGANKVVDSALVVNGGFTISGFVTDPVYSFLVIDHAGQGIAKLGNSPDMLNFFLDKGAINVATAKDSVAHGVITGSPINDDSKALTIQLQSLNDEAAKLNKEKNAASQSKQNSPEFQREVQAEGKLLQDKQQAIFTNFVKTHPASYLSLLVLNQAGKQGTDPAKMDSLFNSLNATLKDMEIAKTLKKTIDDSKITAIGSIAPDFTQPDVNGTPVKLSTLRGKYVLVDFWASWCGPCRMENPTVVKTYNKYKAKNFTVLGVSLDRPGAKTDWLNAIKADNLTWTQVSDLKYWGNQAAVLYFVQAIPANFLLDPNGKIIAKDLRGTDLEDKLAEVLGK